MTMLKEHCDKIERKLLADSEVASSAGHKTDKGTLRELFIRDFLHDHLSEKVAIGTGEVIDANSKPNEKRNQIDIVIYKRDYPKLHLGGDISMFLAESVIATIEVKSILNKAELEPSIKSAVNIKKLKRHFVKAGHAGYQPPSILSYVVAYSGPERMKTVYSNLCEIHKKEGIECPVLGATRKERTKVASPSIDGVFVLGRGFLYFDNAPTSFASNEVHQKHPNVKWASADLANGNLFLLFLFLTQAVSGISFSWLNTMPYLKSLSVNNLYYGE